MIFERLRFNIFFYFMWDPPTNQDRLFTIIIPKVWTIYNNYLQMLQPTKKKDKNAQQSIFQSISHQLRIQLKKQSNQNVTFKQFYPAYDQTHVVWIQKQTYTADHQILRENILYHISSSSKILSSFSSSQKNQAFQRLEMVSDDQVIIFLKPFSLLEKEDKHIVIHQWSLKQDQIITERFPFQSRFPFAYVFPESKTLCIAQIILDKKMSDLRLSYYPLPLTKDLNKPIVHLNPPQGKIVQKEETYTFQLGKVPSLCATMKMDDHSMLGLIQMKKKSCFGVKLFTFKEDPKGQLIQFVFEHKFQNLPVKAGIQLVDSWRIKPNVFYFRFKSAFPPFMEGTEYKNERYYEIILEYEHVSKKSTVKIPFFFQRFQNTESYRVQFMCHQKKNWALRKIERLQSEWDIKPYNRIRHAGFPFKVHVPVLYVDWQKEEIVETDAAQKQYNTYRQSTFMAYPEHNKKLLIQYHYDEKQDYFQIIWKILKGQ